MNLLKPSFLKRVASAAVLIPAVALLLLYEGSRPVTIVLVLAALVAGYEWFQMARRTSRPYLTLFLGTLYLSLTFGSFYVLYSFAGGKTVLLLFALIWVSDIGAYFSGKVIGGPKMAPNISPNKTWAGLAGALLAPAFLSLLLSFVLDREVFYAFYFAAGLLIGLFGQIGDLFISCIKRRANLKDTGDLIPGHGGLLDRIDSVMLASPVALFLLMLGLSLSA